MKLRTFEFFNAGNAQRTGLETSHARSDDDDLTKELRPLVGLDVKFSVFALFDDRHFFTQMELRSEGMNLL